jgi:hypothetical protein
MLKEYMQNLYLPVLEERVGAEVKS